MCRRLRPTRGTTSLRCRFGVANDAGEPTEEGLAEVSVLSAASASGVRPRSALECWAQWTTRPGAEEDYSNRYSNAVRTRPYPAEQRVVRLAMTPSSSRTGVSGPAGAVLSTQVAFLGHDAGREQVARTGRVSDLRAGALDLPTPKESCSRTQQETVTDRAPCPHSGSSTRMRQLLSAFRNCSSKVLRCPEDPPSVARHTPNKTSMSQ